MIAQAQADFPTQRWIHHDMRIWRWMRPLMV
jgi:hypothetical protein